jgi:hypothetical protein
MYIFKILAKTAYTIPFDPLEGRKFDKSSYNSTFDGLISSSILTTSGGLY